MKFQDLIREHVLLCDGAMGTMFYNKGVYLNSCFDELNLTTPDLAKNVHREYVQSGVDIVEKILLVPIAINCKNMDSRIKSQKLTVRAYSLPEKRSEMTLL